MIKYLDLIALIGLATAIIAIIHGWKRAKLNLPVRLLLLSVSMLFFVYCLFLFIEWSGSIILKLEGFEDYFGAMLPLMWIFLFYAILVQLKEHDIWQSKERFRSLVENTGDWIWEADNALIFTYSNPRVKDLLGYDPQEIVGRKITDIVSNEDSERIDRVFREALKSDKLITQVEFMFLDKSGQKKIHEISSLPFFDDQYSVQGFRSVSRDITERKKSQLALYMSEQRFRVIADYTYSWEIWLSLTGTHLWTNPSVERITGYTIHECMNMTDYPRSLIYQADLNAYDQIIQSALKQSCGRDQEIRIGKKDGTPIWVYLSWRSIYDNKGEWQGIRISIIDRQKRPINL